jgi:hypothetical protein
MKRFTSLFAMGAALALTLPVAGASARPATSHRYGYSTFREQTDRVDVLVDGYPATLHAADGFVPVPVTVAVVKGGRPIALTPESFTLVDSQGHAVPAAAYGELLQGYGKMNFDRTMIRQRPLVLGSYYGNLLRVGGAFYPAPGKQTRVEKIEIPAYGYFSDILYFPMPAGGLGGVMTLEVKLPGGLPLQVKFLAAKEEFAKL